MSYAAARAYFGGESYESACAQHPLSDVVMAAESRSARSKQIAREIDAFIARYEPLRASMIITCERRAYAAVPGASCEGEPVPEDLRITFDNDITYRDLFGASADSRPTPLMNAGDVVMEIKASGAFPLWLVRLLSRYRAYPSSFSKYGEAYKACLKRDASPARKPQSTRRFNVYDRRMRKGGRCA